MIVRALPSVLAFALLVLVTGAVLTALKPLGVDPAGRLALDGQALMAADHARTFANFVTAYPPLPFALTSAIAFLGAGLWSHTPVSPSLCAAAAVGGLLVTGWFLAFRRTYRGWIIPLLLTALLVLNPLFLLSLSAGPAAPLTVLGFWMVGVGTYELRRQAIAGDAITIALGLVVIGMSSPFGLTLAIAVSPFLALAAPGELLDRSAVGFLLSMTFPLIMAVLGFAAIAWIFTGDGWAILVGALDQSTKTTVDAPSTALLYAVLAILVTAPIAPVVLVQARGRLQILMPTLALVAGLVAGFVLGRAFGVLTVPALGVAPALALAALMAARWPADDKWRGPWVGALLALGAAGGGAALMLGQAPLKAVTVDSPDQAVGQFLKGKSDVLMDLEAAPGVVAARGGARGLVGPASESFGLALLRHRPETAYVAVSGDELDRRDRIAEGLNRIYDKGAPGYGLVYDRGGWRVYQRRQD